MASKTKGRFAPVAKVPTVPLVVEDGQTFAEALKAAWLKAHTSK